MFLEEEKHNKVIAFIVSTVGAIIVSSSILHLLYTQILPINEITTALLLMLPAAYIGLLNEEIKESMYSMSITIIGTLVLSSITRSAPAILGLLPGWNDVFAFQQIGETIPLLFFVIPFLLVGTMIGVIVNEFALKTRY